MDDNFDETLRKLGERVSRFTNDKSASYSSSSNGIRDKINIKMLLVYGTPLVVSIVVLYFWKPNFVVEEVEDNEGGYKTKVSFRKLAVTALITTVMLDTLVFLYLRKKEIKL